MSIELEDAKVKVALFQKQCEEYLVVLVQQKREADEQQKSVSPLETRVSCVVMAIYAVIYHYLQSEINSFDFCFKGEIDL